MTVHYEWDVEQVTPDSYHDIIDHNFSDTLQTLIYTYEEIMADPCLCLVLVRDVYQNDGTLTDRTHAYPGEIADGLHMAYDFDNGVRIPQRFYNELRRFVTKRI